MTLDRASLLQMLCNLGGLLDSWLKDHVAAICSLSTTSVYAPIVVIPGLGDLA